jgi:hypothetical protein
MMLPDGTYKLARDVKNPERNLRNKRDWTCFEKWEEDDVFFLRTINLKQGESWQELQLKGHSRTITQFSDAFALILMASDRIEETPSLYLKRIHRDDDALRILDHMFTTNMITPEFLTACLADIDAKDNEDT